MCVDYTAYNYVGEIAAPTRRIRAVVKKQSCSRAHREGIRREMQLRTFFGRMEVTSQFQVLAALDQGKDLAGAGLRVGLDALDKKEAQSPPGIEAFLK